MGLCFKVFTAIVILSAISLGLFLKNACQVPEKPVLPLDAYWGPGEQKTVDESIRPFKIDVPADVIQNLNSRLDLWLKQPQTLPLEDQGFQYGFNTNYLKEVVKYWRNDYNWKSRQTVLNKYPQFKTNVNGLDIHFIHVKPQNPGKKQVLPLLLLHGWPGSVKEFFNLIPILTTPRDEYPFVFEVVVPSLPGYGFSEGSHKSGLGYSQIAVVMKNLMQRLSFDKYYVQGGDWGAAIVRVMSVLFPDNVLGVHSNMCGSNSLKTNMKLFLGSFYPPLIVEKKFEHLMYPVSSKFMSLLEESGYMHLQATKPDTIGTALRDTPVGLATYILEKFSTWTNPAFKTLPDGGLTKKFELDDLLDNIMIYWVTGSITTSQRLYAESFSKAHFALGIDQIPVEVPAACARFHHDLMWQSECLLKDAYSNLIQVTDYEDGGHFAAFELPKEFGGDVWQGISKMEKWRKETPKKQ